MALAATKTQLRREVLARVRAIDPADRALQEGRLGEQLETLPGFAVARTVLLYASAFPDEVDTAPWLRRALDLGKRLVCPRVVAERHELELRLVANPEHDLIPGFRSIREPGPDCPVVAPREIDWVLVPGVAFDRSGFRLGRGAGHYDRLLPTLRPDAACWSLILDAQWVAAVPREAHDQPLSGVADHLGVWPGARPELR